MMTLHLILVAYFVLATLVVVTCSLAGRMKR